MNPIEQIEHFDMYSENTGKQIESKLDEIKEYINNFISVGIDIREIPQHLIPFINFSLDILNKNPHNPEIQRIQIREIQSKLSNLIDSVNSKVNLYNTTKAETPSSNKSIMSQLSLPSFRSTSIDSRPTTSDLVQSVNSLYGTPSNDLSQLDLEYYTPQNVGGGESNNSKWRLPRSGLNLTGRETPENSHWMPRTGLDLTGKATNALRVMGIKRGGTRRKHHKKHNTRKYKRSRHIKRKVSRHRTMRRK